MIISCILYLSTDEYYISRNILLKTKKIKNNKAKFSKNIWNNENIELTKKYKKTKDFIGRNKKKDQNMKIYVELLIKNCRSFFWNWPRLDIHKRNRIWSLIVFLSCFAINYIYYCLSWRKKVGQRFRLSLSVILFDFFL